MNTALKLGALAAVVLGFAILILAHQSEKKRLQAQIVSLQEQLSAQRELAEENRALAEQLKSAREILVAERGELMRSRAQVQTLKQLEQENAQLKTKWQRFTNSTQAPPLPPPLEEAATNLVREETTTPVANINLGAVELTHAVPTRFDLGGGQQLVITPSLLDNGSLQMDIAVTVRNASGREEVVGSSRVTAEDGQAVAISVGDRMIALEPNLKLDLEE